MNPVNKLALSALTGVCACVLLLPLSASAATKATTSAHASPCWVTLLNDWYDGRIDKEYPIPCYRDAINHLPTDVAVYSSARDDINRALQLAIAHQKNPNAPVATVTNSSNATGPGGASGATGPSSAGRDQPSGPIPSAINNSSPGGATSFPLPLLILGGLAGFLLLLGAIGLVVRRMQGKRDAS